MSKKVPHNHAHRRLKRLSSKAVIFNSPLDGIRLLSKKSHLIGGGQFSLRRLLEPRLSRIELSQVPKRGRLLIPARPQPAHGPSQTDPSGHAHGSGEAYLDLQDHQMTMMPTHSDECAVSCSQYFQPMERFGDCLLSTIVLGLPAWIRSTDDDA